MIRVELPPPPAGRTGWPWTVPGDRSPDPDPSADWPTITIVTPSYEQAEYLEEAIRSVLLQGYPALEYFVIDGGSADGSVEIVRKYERWLAGWVSEPDAGQGEAIEKGFARATGAIHGYLNSDDVYRPDALYRVARDFLADDRPAWHAYPVEDFDGEGAEVRTVPIRSRPNVPITSVDGYDLHPPPEGREWEGELLPWVVADLFLHQPGVFWRAEHHAAVGGFENRYHYGFDHKFFVELLAAGFPLVCHGGEAVTRFRRHPDSKTVSSRSAEINPFSENLWRMARDLEPLLAPEERGVVRRARNRVFVSRLWRIVEEGGTPGEVGAAIVRSLRDNPRMLASRFFWASVARWADRALGSGRRR